MADQHPSPVVLLLPGWQNSGPAHWQSRWERLHGYRRVEQHDWMQPLRGDWMARLEEEVLAAPAPVLLAAHSLGCLLTAAWSAHTRQAHRVRAALLVAPPDVETLHEPAFHSWRPVVREPLAFPALVVASSNDPFGSIDSARQLATQWGARWLDYGPFGHINADSGLGDWPQGHALLADLMKT